MEGSTLRGKFLIQEHNTMTGSALEPRSLHLELSVLTTLVPCLKMRRKKNRTYFIHHNEVELCLDKRTVTFSLSFS